MSRSEKQRNNINVHQYDCCGVTVGTALGTRTLHVR